MSNKKELAKTYFKLEKELFRHISEAAKVLLHIKKNIYLDDLKMMTGIDDEDVKTWVRHYKPLDPALKDIHVRSGSSRQFKKAKGAP